MRVIVLTGGIATGKSTVVSRLRELVGDTLCFYDCDAEVARLLNDGTLAVELAERFGPDAVDEEGHANKNFLRELIFNDASAKKALEDMVHPLLLKDCLAQIDQARQNPRVQGFIVDVPLYYESGFPCNPDKVCVVAVSEATQHRRLFLRNQFRKAVIRKMTAAQLPISEKVRKADIVFWNEGPVEMLDKQIKLFYHHYIYD